MPIPDFRNGSLAEVISYRSDILNENGYIFLLDAAPLIPPRSEKEKELFLKWNSTNPKPVLSSMKISNLKYAQQSAIAFWSTQLSCVETLAKTILRLKTKSISWKVPLTSFLEEFEKEKLDCLRLDLVSRREFVDEFAPVDHSLPVCYMKKWNKKCLNQSRKASDIFNCKFLYDMSLPIKTWKDTCETNLNCLSSFDETFESRCKAIRKGENIKRRGSKLEPLATVLARLENTDEQSVTPQVTHESEAIEPLVWSVPPDFLQVFFISPEEFEPQSPELDLLSE